jgi:selenocysteine-specific elongation factor
MHVVATAGHVDHGKSTLVQALTGMDPDRFAEEKRRGLTIDLGFAWITLPSGSEVAFVDVPGHSRFVHNMLAGVGSVDTCLYVVSATEGWKPQSEEHLRILELVGVASGLVVISKVGLADDDTRELARADIADHVAGSFLAAAPVVEVDAVLGIGLDELRSELDDLLTTHPVAPDRDRPRLWIDRAFVVRGSGTVVTGTLTGGSLRVGDRLAVVPGSRTVRVRALQALQRDHDVVAPGSRVAVNLTGVSLLDVGRGAALVNPGQWRPASTVDASMRVLASIGHDVTRRGAYTMHVGSAEHRVRLSILGGDSIDAGELGLVRLRLPLALPLVVGDRFVLREDGRDETVGGGEILDVDPVLPPSKARPSRNVDRLIAERGWVRVDDLEALTGERRKATIERWVVAPEALAATAASVRGAVAAAGPLGYDVSLLDERQRAVLPTLDDLVVDLGRVRARDAPPDPLADHPLPALLAASPFSPPEPVGVDRDVLRELVRRGKLVERDGIWFAASALDRAADVVADLLDSHPGGFTAADARIAWGTTRKYALPLLAELDAAGVTRRRGDVRTAGPRLRRPGQGTASRPRPPPAT